eukprot:Filipodium_phascolosomae@DN182_c0_g1_i1.p1
MRIPYRHTTPSRVIPQSSATVVNSLTPTAPTQAQYPMVLPSAQPQNFRSSTPPPKMVTGQGPSAVYTTVRPNPVTPTRESTRVVPLPPQNSAPQRSLTPTNTSLPARLGNTYLKPFLHSTANVSTKDATRSLTPPPSSAPLSASVGQHTPSAAMHGHTHTTLSTHTPPSFQTTLGPHSLGKTTLTSQPTIGSQMQTVGRIIGNSTTGSSTNTVVYPLSSKPATTTSTTAANYVTSAVSPAATYTASNVNGLRTRTVAYIPSLSQQHGASILGDSTSIVNHSIHAVDAHSPYHGSNSSSTPAAYTISTTQGSTDLDPYTASSYLRLQSENTSMKIQMQDLESRIRQLEERLEEASHNSIAANGQQERWVVQQEAYPTSMEQSRADVKARKNSMDGDDTPASTAAASNRFEWRIHDVAEKIATFRSGEFLHSTDFVYNNTMGWQLRFFPNEEPPVCCKFGLWCPPTCGKHQIRLFVGEANNDVEVCTSTPEAGKYFCCMEFTPTEAAEYSSNQALTVGVEFLDDTD